MKFSLNARTLRILLLLVMVLIVAGSISGFLLLQKNLSEYATTISTLNAKAQSGDQSLQTLRRLKERVEADADSISLSKSLMANESDYIDETIKDITDISRASGVRVTGFEFTETDTTSGSASGAPAATAPTTPTTPAPGAAGGQAAAPAPAQITGATRKSVSVTINSPVNYNRYVDFLSRPETNRLKFFLPDISLTKSGSSSVTTEQVLNIEFYVRNGG